MKGGWDHSVLVMCGKHFVFSICYMTIMYILRDLKSSKLKSKETLLQST